MCQWMKCFYGKKGFGDSKKNINICLKIETVVFYIVVPRNIKKRLLHHVTLVKITDKFVKSGTLKYIIVNSHDKKKH